MEEEVKKLLFTAIETYSIESFEAVLKDLCPLMGYAIACRRNEIVKIIRKYPDYDSKLRVSR